MAFIKNFFIPCFLFLFCFFILISTIPSSVYLGDCGETITCSFTLGIQHPPGYPLFTLSGKIFSLLPAGDFSFRIYLFSLFLSVINTVFIYFFVLKNLQLLGIKNSLIVPFFSSLFYIFGWTIWQQSIIAKGGIYILNIMFVILITIILFEIYKNRNIKYIYLFSLIFGLSLTHHHMSQIILLPVYLFFLYKSRIHTFLKTKNYFLIFLFFILGISLYIYHPIRAKTAILNWGDPSNLKNFLWVISRYQYFGSEISRSFLNSLNQIFKFFLSLSYENLFVGIFFIIIGAIYLYKTNKNIFIYFTGIILLFLIITAAYLNLTKDRLYIMETYITPVYFPASIFLSIGIYFLANFLKINLRFIILFSIFLIILQIIIFFPKLDKSRYFFAYDYNKNLIISADYKSILFTAGDGIVFPTWYLKYVKKFRTDITLVGSPVLPMKWVRDNITKQNPDIKMPGILTDKIGTESIGKIINAIINLNINFFPIYFSYNKPEENSLDKNLEIMPKGLIFRVIPAQFAFINEQYLKTLQNLWKIYSLRCLFPPFKNYADEKTKELYLQDYAISLNSAGVLLEEKNFLNEALSYYQLAAKISPFDPVYYFNAGNVYYAMKDYEKAVYSYKKSISVDPGYENAWYNLGVTYYINLKNFEDALLAFKKVKEINVNRKDIDATINFLEKVLNKK